jgi:nicotinamidase-related amidase
MELNPSTTAVIAVHMQPDIVTADGAFGPFFAAQAAEHDVVGVIGKLQDAARGAGVAVIYTRVAWKSDYSDLNPNSPLLGMVVEKNCLVDGRDMAEIVLFAGVATNASVEGTARQASDLGYRTVIISDACSAADQRAHDASLNSLGLLAEIITSAEAVGAISGATVTA